MIRLSEIKHKVPVALKSLNILAAVPGAILIALGIVMLAAPEYLYISIAVSVMAFGSICVLYGYRLQRAVEKLRKSVNDVEARVFIQGFRSNESQDKVSDQKKITYH